MLTIVLMAALAGQGGSPERVRGLVALPEIFGGGPCAAFEPQEIALHASPGDGKPIAFICHAGWVPISAGIVRGRRGTSVGAIRDDLVNAGMVWEDSPVVVDGNLISSRTPADLGAFSKAIIAALR